MLLGALLEVIEFSAWDKNSLCEMVNVCITSPSTEQKMTFS
jgi:hypothetical protein